MEHPNGTPHGVSLSQCYSSAAPLKSAGMTYIVPDYPFIRPSLPHSPSLYPSILPGLRGAEGKLTVPLQRADKTPSVSNQSNTHWLLHSLSPPLSAQLYLCSFPMFLTLSQSSLRGITFFTLLSITSLSPLPHPYLFPTLPPFSYFFALITFPLSSF